MRWFCVPSKNLATEPSAVVSVSEPLPVETQVSSEPVKKAVCLDCSSSCTASEKSSRCCTPLACAPVKCAPVKCAPVKCLPLRWCKSSVASPEPLVIRSTPSTDTSEMKA
jgi:hypothetical protein